MEKALLELFATQMSFMWCVPISRTTMLRGSQANRASATNCARVYNISLAEFAPLPYESNLTNVPAFDFAKLPQFEWKTRLHLTTDDVSDGFFLYSLLMDSLERKTALLLPHDEPNQRARLDDALRCRNVNMEGTGQEMWAHACDLCFKVFKNDEGEYGAWNTQLSS
jgi:hypothetical protein